MKRLLSIIVLNLIFVLSVNAQGWINQGAKWNYDVWSTIGMEIDIFEYTKDTIIQTHNCQQIKELDYTLAYYSANNFTVLNPGPPKYRYTYNNGDTVYFLHDSIFYILYNFSAKIGDTWIISTDTTDGCMPSIVSVLDTGSMQINNKAKRWLKVETNIGSKYYFKGKIIEGIGMTERGSKINSTIFPRQIVCDTNAVVEYYYYNFHCFSDLTLGSYNPTTVDCDYWFTNSSIDNNSIKDISLKIFPNPAEKRIIFELIKIPKQAISVKIFNIVGKELKFISFAENEKRLQIDISDFPSGVYFYHLNTENNLAIKTGKFIKK